MTYEWEECDAYEIKNIVEIDSVLGIWCILGFRTKLQRRISFEPMKWIRKIRNHL